MRISDWSSDVCSADLERIVRRTDLVARPGGDEFTIVLVGIDNISKIEQIAQTIIDEVRKPLDIGNELKVQIGASIGIALIRADDDSPASALHRADAAMYEIGRASCRERVCQEVSLSVDGGALKKKQDNKK